MANFKSISIVIGLLQFTLASTGQSIVPGYCILPNNDTSFITIKIPKEPFGKLNAISLQKKLKVYDSLGHLKKIKPADIKEFDLTYKALNYHFVAKQFNGESWDFFEVLSKGPSVALFYHFYKTKQGLHEYFILEKKQGVVLKLKNVMRQKKIRSLLKDYFEGNQLLINKIDSLPFRFRTVKKSLLSIVSDENNGGNGTAL